MSKLVIPGVIASAGGSGGSGGSVTVDSALSPTSENPVQNKVITTALEDVYTQDNLVAGTNISITEVPQPVIDDNTTGLYHFDESYVDAITGTNPYNIENVSTIQYTEGKFGKALRMSGGYAYFGPQEYSQTTQSFTYDVWLRPDTTSVNYYTFPIWTQQWQRTGIEINNSRQVLKIGIRVSGRTSGSDPEVPLPTIVWGDWVHLAYVNDASNKKVYIFLNGKKAYEETVATNYNTRVWGPVDNSVCNWDELRISNVARWTSDFTPFSAPYSTATGETQYQINNTQPAPDLSSYLQNTATGTNALTILGTSATGQNQINIGSNTKINWGNNAIILGTGITSNGHNEILIGSGTKSGGGCCTVIGSDLGGSSWATFTTSVGYGNDCSGGSGSARLALGAYSKAQNGETIAIGAGHLSNPAVASAANSIQLGGGTNSTANTFQVFNYQMLDGTTGKIPVERLPSGNSIEVTDIMPTSSSSNVGQVKLYSGTTTSNFINGYLYQCKLESTTSETVTFDSDKISATPELFWLVVKIALPETYSNVTNGNITYTESANLVTFTFKDADNTVLAQFPGDVGELSAIGFTFNNLTDGDVINFTCFSGTIESYEWEPLIVQESSEIKIYNAPSWSQNTTLFPNCRLSLPNIDDLTEPGIFRVKYTENDENGSINLDYLCNVSQFTANGTIVGIFQSLQVIYPSIGNDSGINATLYRSKISGGTWSNWKSSLVTSVSSNSIYSEYVSAKLFYDTCGNIEALINAL